MTPKLYAHRGACREAPENSLEAFQKALDIGVDGIEVDCVLTKDKIPVVTHYDDLSILKIALGKVSQKTWNEIKDLGLPSLAQVLELAKPANVRVVLDIKPQPGMMFETPCLSAGLAQEMLPVERILLSSFYVRHLLTLKKHFAHIKRAAILYQNAFRLVPPPFFDKFYGVSALHPFLKWTTKDLVEKWQKKGFEVNVWVPNTPEAWKRCQEMGVDGIFTDESRACKTWLMKKI
ncbi:MAG: glycerophosphodiester phosphodiesterase [Deltaproteobacteria bacterium]|nr:glycerophosphodiester phosphodiesterase [Deltaproteobacteria bacterium]MDZ4224907.1 glycerophosphodiester phosphodiesterase [bacterium]